MIVDSYIVDFQGFKRSLNKFVFKELAIVAVEGDSQPSVFYFQAPFPWSSLPQEYKSSNSWLIRNYHGLVWESGQIPYEALQQTLEAALINARAIYVKGLEKKNWLAELLPTKYIYNLESLGCPALHKLSLNSDYTCSNHSNLSGFKKKNLQCAAENTQLLKTWFLDNSRDVVG